MDELKVFGTPYFKELFKKQKEKPKIEYSDRRIPIGLLSNGRVYYMDLREATRVSFIASSGGGKTFMMRAMIDRLKKINHDCIFLTDIKGELVSSMKPVQFKFRRLLLPGEKPTALPLISLRPTFFKQISKSLPKDNLWYSLDMRRMTAREFMTFMNAKQMTPTQRTMMDIIYQEITKRFREDKDAKFSLEFIEEVIDNIEEIDVRSRNSMKLKFRPLKTSNFFIEEFERSIIKGLQKGLVPAINLTDFESFGRESLNYPVTTLSIILREIIMGRRSKELNPLWIFVDEATRFCGNDKDNAFKDEMLEGVDVERRHGTSFVMAWQSMGDIPQKIFYQSRYVFVPGTENVNTFKDLLNNTGMAPNVQSAPGMATKLKRQTRGRPYAWVVFDRKTQTMEVIDPLAPLSRHMEGAM